MERYIIGLTGAFGSGTTFLAQNFFEKMDFDRCSLSDLLRKEYRENNKIQDDQPIDRSVLQDFGNEVRKTNAAYLAEKLDEQIISKAESSTNFVIESIRNPAEIKFFREKYPEFILIGVFADYIFVGKELKTLMMAQRISSI